MNTITTKSKVITLKIQLSDAAPSEAIPEAYVREANGTSELDVNIANRGFTLVLPAFEDETFDELLMTFSTPENVGIASSLITFKSGEASIDTVTQDEVIGTFKRGDKAKIVIFLRVYDDVWMVKDSTEYDIV